MKPEARRKTPPESWAKARQLMRSARRRVEDALRQLPAPPDGRRPAGEELPRPVRRPEPAILAGRAGKRSNRRQNQKGVCYDN